MVSILKANVDTERIMKLSLFFFFAVHQAQEKCQEQQQDLYAVFTGLTKAFVLVSHAGASEPRWVSRKANKHYPAFSQWYESVCY